MAHSPAGESTPMGRVSFPQGVGDRFLATAETIPDPLWKTRSAERRQPDSLRIFTLARKTIPDPLYKGSGIVLGAG